MIGRLAGCSRYSKVTCIVCQYRPNEGRKTLIKLLISNQKKQSKTQPHNINEFWRLFYGFKRKMSESMNDSCDSWTKNTYKVYFILNTCSTRMEFTESLECRISEKRTMCEKKSQQKMKIVWAMKQTANEMYRIDSVLFLLVCQSLKRMSSRILFRQLEAQS